MKIPFAIITLLATSCLPQVIPQESSENNAAGNNQARRIRRETSADQMVQNIFEWLEGLHTTNNRKIRQEGLRTYLPPKQSPRPFEPAPFGDNTIPGMNPPGQYSPPPSAEKYPDVFPPAPSPFEPSDITVPPSESSPESSSEPETPEEQPNPPETSDEPNVPAPESEQPSDVEKTEYPPAGPNPQSPFLPSEPESTGYPAAGEQPQPPFELPGTPDNQATPSPIEPVPVQTDIPSAPIQPPASPEPTNYPSPNEASDESQPIVPSEPTGYPPASEPPQQPAIAEDTPESPAGPQVISTFPPILRETTENTDVGKPETDAPSPIEPSSPTEEEEKEKEEPGNSESPPVPTLPEVNSAKPTAEIETPESEGTSSQPSLPDVNEQDVPSQPEEDEGIETEKPAKESSDSAKPPSTDEAKHPPHIHTIDVVCAKDMMTINVEFNKQFNGIIYSKGFYTNPECRYVNENSRRSKFSFTVKLDSCGTQFVNAFDTQNKSYLENVLVLQNEADIQEVWDTIRSVRCLWEGSLSKSLTISLSIGMLSQETITFSGDTAVARLDIQRGEGPFAPSANGLVPIGEKMTLVISVSGDPGFDIHVKDCRATDTVGSLKYPLTNQDGCVLKPKLFGAFQKTRDTGTTGASIIAYAFFNAFKFPDLMDLMIECNVELCKTDCDVCPNPNQKIQPGKRRRRDIYNETMGEPVRVGKLLRVLVPEDLSSGETLIEFKEQKEFCLSVTSFVLGSVFLISLLVCSTLFSAYMFLKRRTTPYKHEL